ncbi:MAG TPA: hypothetical protein VFU10_12225 [Gaiellaceae bacterium]|nr:hypothetical protein [Gaiellaceae bacterium]
MKRLMLITLVAAAGIVVAVAAAADRHPANGLFAFNRDDPVLHDDVVYTANPDGSDVRRVLDHAEQPHWAPDGIHLIAFPHDADNVEGRIVDTGTGRYRDLPAHDPGVFIPCGIWSPQGDLLACSGYSDEPDRNGMYLVSPVDGTVLRQLTSNPETEDDPGGFSPAGNRLVFKRFRSDGPDVLYVAQLTGSDRLQRLTPPGMPVGGGNGSWSPRGNEIVFSGESPADTRNALFVVHSDGSGLTELPVTGCGTTAGCVQPQWSPDGTEIVFKRFEQGQDRGIYTVAAGGGTPTAVTPGNVPDWGRQTGSAQ